MAEQKETQKISTGNTHPMHPVFVHFPIALFPLSLLFIALWFWSDGQSLFYFQASYWSYLLGALMIIPVALTGIRDIWHVKIEDIKGQQLLYTHVIVGSTMGIISIPSGLYYLLNNPLFEYRLIPGFIFFSILLSVMVSIQGFIGGVMVYNYRVGITERTAK